MRGAGLAIEHAGLSGDSGYDFLGEGGGKKIVVEVKKGPIPRQLLARVVERLREAAERTGSEPLLVTKTPPSTRESDHAVQGVKIMTPSELKKYLKYLTFH